MLWLSQKHPLWKLATENMNRKSICLSVILTQRIQIAQFKQNIFYFNNNNTTFCFLTRINILFHYYSFSLVFMLSSDNFKWQFQTKFQTEILILTGSARFLWAVGNTRMWAQLVTTYLLLSQKITDWSKISVELTQGNQSVSYLNLNPINRVFEAIDLCTLQPRMNASKIDLFISSKGVKYPIKSLPPPQLDGFSVKALPCKKSN